MEKMEDYARMPKFPIQSCFIAQLAKTLGARKVLEIGKSSSSKESTTLVQISSRFFENKPREICSCSSEKGPKNAR